MTLLVAALVAMVLVLFLLVTFPPRGARRWRRHTRPLRRIVRPRHYRAW